MGIIPVAQMRGLSDIRRIVGVMICYEVSVKCCRAGTTIVNGLPKTMEVQQGYVRLGRVGLLQVLEG